MKNAEYINVLTKLGCKFRFSFHFPFFKKQLIFHGGAVAGRINQL